MDDLPELKHSPPSSAADASKEHYAKLTVPNVSYSESETIPPSNSPTHDGKSINAKTNMTREKPKKSNKNKSSSYDASSSSVSSTSHSRQRGVRVSRKQRNPSVLIGPRRPVEGEIEALALPLGMSIAAVVAQVLERKDSTGEVIAVDNLSEICILAVRESLANVFGDKFDLFVKNFEKSFRSTLMTLRLIHESSRSTGDHPNCLPEKNDSIRLSQNKEKGSTCSSGVRDCHSDTIQRTHSAEDIPDILKEMGAIGTDPTVQELTMFDGEVSQVACVSSSGTMHSSMNKLVINAFEKSVVEQTRANDLKKFEIGLTMRKLQIKEKQLALASDLNSLERCKLSVGVSKASFKAEKFRTELEETRHAELLKKCTDCLVAGMLVMLVSVGYGTYVYSHDRLTEATSSCLPAEESRPWWLLKFMSSFNSGLQALWCQVQVISRMLFGFLMILAIAYLLLQRSATSTRTMPVTFILLLGVACGFAGKVCIDTLGGSGYFWLLNWEAMCLVHFFSNIFTSALFRFLHGPIVMTKDINGDKTLLVVPYWARRMLFYATVVVLLPLLCGLVPFAAISEWIDHFSLQPMINVLYHCIERVLYCLTVLVLTQLLLAATVLCKRYLTGKTTCGSHCSRFLSGLLGWVAMRLDAAANCMWKYAAATSRTRLI